MGIEDDRTYTHLRFRCSECGSGTSGSQSQWQRWKTHRGTDGERHNPPKNGLEPICPTEPLNYLMQFQTTEPFRYAWSLEWCQGDCFITTRLTHRGKRCKIMHCYYVYDRACVCVCAREVKRWMSDLLFGGIIGAWWRSIGCKTTSIIGALDRVIYECGWENWKFSG